MVLVLVAMEKTMPYRKTACLLLLVFLAFPIPGKAEPQAAPAFYPVVATHNAGGGNLTGYLLGGGPRTDGFTTKLQPVCSGAGKHTASIA